MKRLFAGAIVVPSIVTGSAGVAGSRSSNGQRCQASRVCETDYIETEVALHVARVDS